MSFVCQTLRRSECMWHHELSGRSSPAKSVVDKTGVTLCQPKQCSNSLKITTKSKINRRFTYKNHQFFRGKWSEPAVNLQGCTLYMFLSFILGSLREKKECHKNSFKKAVTDNNKGQKWETKSLTCFTQPKNGGPQEEEEIPKFGKPPHVQVPAVQPFLFWAGVKWKKMSTPWRVIGVPERRGTLW